MYLLCLWNSPKEYENTVHNLGAIFANIVKKQLNSLFKNKIIDYSFLIKNQQYSLETYTLIKNYKLRILMFDGYINYTGIYMKENLEQLPNFKNEELIVIYDDITLLTGSTIITYAKGSGFHNGAKGIDKNVCKNYWRLRIGYEKPKQINANDFVISKINENFKQILSKITFIFLTQYFTKIKQHNCESKIIMSIQEHINFNFKQSI